MDTSSDEGSKNEPLMESLTNWSLSSFVKPDPKPIGIVAQSSKTDITEDVSNCLNAFESTTRRKTLISPKCLSNESNNLENIGKSM